uniref:PARP catalytic domain-containing protein n=1 Tax=Arundo donax TaxID=35708 RepID=A0A0A9G3C3_ARUDO
MSIAEADDKGQAYLLLCRIVQGRPNVVHAGSHWFGSRMEQIRSVGAVDDLFNPSWYVIWRPVPIPVTVNMQKVHKEFKRFLPSSELQVLETYFNTNMGNSYNFSQAVCELVGAAMFVGAVLRSLEH